MKWLFESPTHWFWQKGEATRTGLLETGKKIRNWIQKLSFESLLNRCWIFQSIKYFTWINFIFLCSSWLLIYEWTSTDLYGFYVFHVFNFNIQNYRAFFHKCSHTFTRLISSAIHILNAKPAILMANTWRQIPKCQSTDNIVRVINTDVLTSNITIYLNNNVNWQRF